MAEKQEAATSDREEAEEVSFRSLVPWQLLECCHVIHTPAGSDGGSLRGVRCSEMDQSHSHTEREPSHSPPGCVCVCVCVCVCDGMCV